jgi:hypothetical protein
MIMGSLQPWHTVHIVKQPDWSLYSSSQFKTKSTRQQNSLQRAEAHLHDFHGSCYWRLFETAEVPTYYDSEEIKEQAGGNKDTLINHLQE